VQAAPPQDALFDEYAAACLAEYRGHGKSTVPMELLLSQKKGFEVLV
jgi:hypothetical protein